MDIYKIKWTRLQSEILRFLCIRAGQAFNLREIARQLKVTPTAVSNALKELKTSGLVSVESSKTINLMSILLNRDNKKAIEFKRAENLRMIYESGIFDLLYNEFPGCTIILFGSYSKGYDVSSSDIDLAIIGTKERKIDLSKFDKLLERKVSINFYDSWKCIHNHLKDNILDVITLSGGVEL